MGARSRSPSVGLTGEYPPSLTNVEDVDARASGLSAAGAKVVRPLNDHSTAMVLRLRIPSYTNAHCTARKECAPDEMNSAPPLRVRGYKES